MANRFSNISTSSFKPLDLNTIMAVPLAKQAQHDSMQASADEYSALQAQSLSQDSEAVNARLNELRGKSDAISQQLLEKGVDRNLQRQLRELKREKEKEYGQEGLIGNAQQNYKSAMSYINDLATKKEQQAGWSPAQAKAWAQKQVGSFQGSRNEDGTFNSFQGKGLSVKVDRNKWILDNIKNVAKDKIPIALQNYTGEDGSINLPLFQQALISGSIESKDLDKIMSSLGIAASNDDDLKASLLQEAAFKGEDPKDALDFGSMIVKYDKNGKNPRKVWSPGKSSFGRQMYGLGYGAQSRSVSESHKILTDSVAYDLKKQGMETKDALTMVQFNRGEMNQINPGTLEEVQDNLRLAGDSLGQMLSASIARKKEVEANGGDPLKDKEYQRLQSNYEKSSVEYQNSSSRLDNIYKKVEEKSYTKVEKKEIEVFDIIDKYGTAIKALENLDIKIDPNWKEKNPGKSLEMYSKIILMKEMGLNFQDYMPGNKRSGKLGESDFYERFENKVNGTRNSAVKKYLEANPKADYFTIFNAESTPKFATKISRINKMMTENFNPDSAQLAYGKGLFADSAEMSELGESEKGYDYKVEMTDGHDDDGHKFKNVVVTNRDNGKVSSIQVIDDMNNDLYREMANQLSQGSYSQKRYANQILADLDHMPDVKKSGMLYQDEGVIGGLKLSEMVNGKKENVNVKWTRVPGPDKDHFIATVGLSGEFLNNGQPIYSQKEMSLYIKKYMDEKIEASQEKEK